MKKTVLFFLIAMATMMVSCNKTTQVNEQKESIEAQTSLEVSAVRTALVLAKYGYEVESASALIEAANILASTPTQSLPTIIQTGEENANEADKTEKTALTPENILKDARGWAEGDANLLALADKVQAKLDVKAEGTRGAVGGPQSATGTVYANSYVCFDVKFRANEIGEVFVMGDGDTDLDLYLYDDHGNLITSDTDYTDDCYVEFYVYETSYFRIKIINRGKVYNNFLLFTN